MPSIRTCLFLSLLLYFACNTKSDAVNSVATEYLDARLKSDFGRASLYTTPESLPRLEELATLEEEYDGLNLGSFSFRILETTFQKDTAIVVYELDGYGSDQIRLVFRQNTWQLILTPQDIPDMLILTQDLLQLESEDTISKLQRSLDSIVFKVDSIPFENLLSPD